MSKLELHCEICRNQNHLNAHLTLCCHQVICSSCYSSSHHKCTNHKTLQFSEKNSSPTLCFRCSQQNSVIQCIGCLNNQFCLACFDFVHSSSKFIFHKKKKISQAKGITDQLPSLKMVIENQRRKNERDEEWVKTTVASENQSEKQNIIEEYRQNAKLRKCLLEKNKEIAERKWNAILNDLKNQFIQLEDSLSLKRSEFILEIERMRSIELHDLSKYQALFLDHDNFEKIYQYSLQDAKANQFLLSRIKSTTLQSNEVKALQAFKLPQFSILQDCFDDLKTQIGKLSLKKIMSKKNSTPKGYEGRVSLTAIPNFQTPTTKKAQADHCSVKNLFNFLTKAKKGGENVKIISDFSLSMQSPSQKNLTKIKSENHIPMENCKNKTVTQKMNSNKTSRKVKKID